MDADWTEGPEETAIKRRHAPQKGDMPLFLDREKCGCLCAVVQKTDAQHLFFADGRIIMHVII